MDWLTIGQSIINGLLIGGVYALVAVGLTIIFGVMGIVNFAQGEYLMIGMYITWLLTTYVVATSPYWMIFIVAPLMFLIGVGIYKLTVSRVVGKGDELYILLTIGTSVLLQNGALLIFSADYRSIDSAIKGAALQFGELSIPTGRFIACVVAVLLVLLFNFFLNRTDLGRQMRACGESQEIGQLLGINPERTYAIAFGLGIALAGIAGLLLSPIFYIFPRIGVMFNTTAFVVVVLGGMGNVVGALLGGLIIGVMEALTGSFIALDLSQLGTFFIFLLMLFFRPYGLFGKRGGI